MTDLKNIESVSRYFQEIGLKSVSSSGFNLQWKGTIKGREVSVLFSKRTKAKYHGEHVRTREYAGHQVVFETPLKIATRFSVTKKEDNSKFALKLRSFVGLEPFRIEAEMCRELTAYSCDPEWAKEFTASEDVQRALSSEFLSFSNTDNVVFGLFPSIKTPGLATFTCRVPISSITEQMCKLTLESLITLADKSEQCTPRKVVSLTRIERFIKERPFLFILSIFVFVILLGVLFSLTLIGIVMSGVTPLVVPAFFIVMYLLYRRYLK
ncbi:MAG: hypothetical protein KDD64_17350 [Bdellovibrionales bacterium]|nr:hypothetical protein [Bdellovibrionales bacterium]